MNDAIELLRDELAGTRRRRKEEVRGIFDPTSTRPVMWSEVYRLDGYADALAFAIGVIEAASR